MRISQWILEEAKLGIKQTKAEKVRRRAINTEGWGLVGWQTARAVGLKLRWTQCGCITRVCLADCCRVPLTHSCFTVFGVKLMPDDSNIKRHRCVSGDSAGVKREPICALHEITAFLGYQF